MADIVTQLKDKWFLLIFLASIVLWYGNVNSRLNAVEAKQTEQVTIREDIVQLKIDMAVVKENVLIIKSAVAK